MNHERFKNTWDSLLAENTFHRFIVIGLLITNALCLIGLLSQEKTTVLVPPTLHKKAEISMRAASANYKKSWSQYIASLLGNTTPGNSDFVFESIASLLSPDVYNNVKKGMNTEVQMMRRDGVIVSFHPKQIEYEPETGKCFVIGRTNISAVTGDISSFSRVYEVTVQMDHGQPLITYLDSYVGEAKTLKYLQNEKLRLMKEKTATRNKENMKKMQLEVTPLNENIDEQLDETIQD